MLIFVIISFCLKCANSRTWTQDQKLKKSQSAKNSIKVKKSNSSEEKRKLLSFLVKQQHIAYNKVIVEKRLEMLKQVYRMRLCATKKEFQKITG